MRFRSKAIALIICLTASSAFGDTIEIQAPDSVAVGQNIQIFVDGIEPEVLPKAIAKHWPRKQTTFVAAKTWGNKPFIWFEARLPGRYLIEITVPRLVDGEATLEHAEVVLVVGGEPEPQPNPTPVPVPPGKVSMVVIEETGDRGAATATMMGALTAYRRTSGISLPFLDPDLIHGVTEERPERLKKYYAALEANPVKLPALVIVAGTPDGRSSVVAVKSLGGLSGADAVALVKSYEGKQ